MEEKVVKKEENLSGDQKKLIPFKELFKRTFSIKEDSASPEEVRSRIVGGGHVTGTNAILLFLAIIIACIGLNTNSTAVIIGAMLVSPLMGSILSLAYGTVTGDKRVAERSGWGLFIQIVISISTSTLFFLISPMNEATPELLARTKPSLFDVLLAFTGGLAGIIGNTRKDKSNNVIPGIAIATALMPPLCTCGYSLAHGRWTMFVGAFYLFIINAYFIYTSAEVVLALMKLPRMYTFTEKQIKLAKIRRIRNSILVVIPAVLAMIHVSLS